MIFYTIRSAKLSEWIKAGGMTTNIDTNEDMASVFSIELDEDFDRIAHKITQRQFRRVYLSWIHYCLSKCDSQVLCSTADRWDNSSTKYLIGQHTDQS